MLEFGISGCRENRIVGISNNFYPKFHNMDAQTLEPQEVVIETPEQLERYLYSLQDGASASVAAALKAQLEVVRLVKTGKLITTPIDSMLQMLLDAKRTAKDEEEKLQLERQFATMIQNYIFFYDAGIQYKMGKLREDKWKLYNEAVDLLTNSAEELAKQVIKSKLELFKSVGKIVFKNFMKSENEEPAFMKKVLSWFQSEEDLSIKNKEFHHALYLIFQKMGKYHEILGKDLRLAGLITDYSDAVAANEVAPLRAEIEAQRKSAEREETAQGGFLFFIGLGIAGGAVVIFIIRCIIEFFSGIGSFFSSIFGDDTPDEPWFWSHVIWTCVFGFIGFVILLLAGSGITDDKNKKLQELDEKQIEVTEQENKIKEELLGYAKQLDII